MANALSTNMLKTMLPTVHANIVNVCRSFMVVSSRLVSIRFAVTTLIRLGAGTFSMPAPQWQPQNLPLPCLVPSSTQRTGGLRKASL